MQKLTLLIGIAIGVSLWAGPTGLGQQDDQRLSIHARYELIKGTRKGRLIVECQVPPGSHLYSLKQANPPGPTKIKVPEDARFKFAGEFKADRDPEVIDPDPIFGTRIEQFYDKVVFTAPVEFAEDPIAKNTEIELSLTCQVCSDSECVLFRDKKSTASFEGYFDPDAEANKKNPPSVTHQPAQPLVPRQER